MAKKEIIDRPLDNIYQDWETTTGRYKGSRIREAIQKKFKQHDDLMTHYHTEQNTIFNFDESKFPTGDTLYKLGNSSVMIKVYVTSTITNITTEEEREFDKNVRLSVRITNKETSNTEEKIVGIIKANEVVEVDLKNYLTTGTYIQFVAYSIAGEASHITAYSNKVYNVDVVNFNLGFRNDNWWATPFRQNDTEWMIPLLIQTNLSGTILRYTLTNSSTTITKDIDTFSTNYNLKIDHPVNSGGNSGIYSLTIKLIAPNGFESIVAPEYTFDIFCLSTSDINSYIIVNNFVKEVQNYTANVILNYAVVRGYGERQIAIESYIDGQKVAHIENPITVDNEYANYSVELQLDMPADVVADMVTNVSLDNNIVYTNNTTVLNELGYGSISGAVTNIRFAGKNNNSNDREIIRNLVDNSIIESEITGVTWSEVDGYIEHNLDDGSIETSLRLLSESKLALQLKPFNITGNTGKTIEFDFQCDHITDYNADIITIATDGNDNNFIGLKITGDQIKINTRDYKNPDNQYKKYNAADRNIITVILYPNYTYDNIFQYNAIKIYINGSLNKEFKYNNDININSIIKIGSDEADIDLYTIRIYDRALTTEEVEQNTCNLQPTLTKKAAFKSRNDIRENGKVNYEKVKSKCNVFIIKTDDDSLPNLGFGIDNKVGANLRFEYCDTPQYNWSIDKTNIYGQGTTSMEYYRWNGRTKSILSTAVTTYIDGSTDTGKVKLMGNKYPAAKKIAWKINFASGMQSHKIGSVNSYTDLARACNIISESDPRLSIYQIPCVGFQELADGTMEFIGLYTIGPDKSDKPTFGYTNDSIAIEGTNNERPGTSFCTPWNRANVTVDSKGEKYFMNGLDSWEDGLGNIKGMLKRWAPVHNFVYLCKQKLKVFNSSIEEFNNKLTTQIQDEQGNWVTVLKNPDDAYTDYWQASTHKLYTYRQSSMTFVESIITSYTDAATSPSSSTGVVDTYCNMKELYVDKGYVAYTSISEQGIVTEHLLTTELINSTSDIELLNEYYLCARRDKFKKEADTYFDLKCAYFHLAYMENRAASDNRNKNTYPQILKCSDDSCKVRWKQDDLDTIFDIENQGLSKKLYCVETNDDYSEYGMASSDVFNGKDNQFWYLVETVFAKEYFNFVVNSFMSSLRGSGTNPLERALNHFQTYYWNVAQEYFSEALYNEFCSYCYEAAYSYAGQYQHKEIALRQIHGNHYSAEKYWVSMRLLYLMSKYRTDYFDRTTNDSFATRAPRGTNTYTITPAIYMYPVMDSGGNPIVGPRIYPGNPNKSWAGSITVSGSDESQQVLGVSFLSSIGVLYNKHFDRPLSISGKLMKTLLIGNKDMQSTDITSKVPGVGFTNMASLRKCDLSNITTLGDTVNLTSAVNLRELYSINNKVTGINLCNGGPLKIIKYPATITEIKLVGKKFITEISTEGYDNIESLIVTDCNDIALNFALDIILNSDI